MKAIYLGMAFVLALPVLSPAQSPAPPTTAEKQHRDLVEQQSLQRLKSAEKILGEAIEALKSGRETPAASAPPAANNAPAGNAAQPAEHSAVLHAERALADVRRAIDELGLPEDRRQRVLDRLDDADSAMRMARQPNAPDERLKLANRLAEVQQEVKTAQQP